MGNASTLSRTCRTCGMQGSVPEDFEEVRRICRTCKKAQQVARHKTRLAEDPQYVVARRSYQRVHNYKRLYNLTPEQRDALLSQGCGICGSTDNLRVDHDHKTGLVRGTLCHNHNVGLGMFGDDPVALLSAVAYLQNGN